VDRTAEELLARAKRLAHRVTYDELVAQGMAAFEEAGFDGDQIDDVARMVRCTADELAHSMATAGRCGSVGSHGGTKDEQPSDPALEKIDKKASDVLKLLLAQRSSELVQKWYEIAEAAERMGLSAFTLRQACNLGRIRDEWRRKDHRTGKWRVHRDAITWVKNNGLPPLDR